MHKWKVVFKEHTVDSSTHKFLEVFLPIDSEYVQLGDLWRKFFSKMKNKKVIVILITTTIFLYNYPHLLNTSNGVN